MPLLSLGLVTGFSLFTLGVIKNPLKKTKEDQFNVIHEKDKLKRGIATVMISESTVRTLLETSCYFNELKKTVESSQVQFNFLDCLPKERSIKLINRTNGYEAQIFPSRGKKVSSDFVQLQRGENELVLEISSTPGQIKSQIIKINRIK